MKQDDSNSWFMRPGPFLPQLHPDQQVLAELVKVLSMHPGGLRRWSVMRAIRSDRDRASRPVSLEFESEIERVFRASCADGNAGRDTGAALFYRPEGKAGEVWAVHADRARAWLHPEAANSTAPLHQAGE